MRATVREHAHLRACLKHCRHCGIFFLTHPCNAARKDLRCPFGCRAGHRKRSSAARTAAYYARYPQEKRRHNRNRYLHSARSQRREANERAVAVEVKDKPIIDHVRMLSRLIDGRGVSREEVVEMHARIWRQRRLAGGRKLDNILMCLNRGPP